MRDCFDLPTEYEFASEGDAFRHMNDSYRGRSGLGLRKGKKAPVDSGPCEWEGEHVHVHENGSGRYVGAIVSCPCVDLDTAVWRYRVIWTR